MRRTARAQIPTTCITSVEHLFVPACYILYIYIDSFLFFFLSSFFPSSLFSFHAATTIFAHPAPPSRLLYTHLRAYQTYANACKSEYAHWRNGAINKDTTFLERSPGSFNSPPSPSDRISTIATDLYLSSTTYDHR